MARRKRTSKKVPAKGRLRDMADRLWSLAVRADWNHRCAVCGSNPCDAHHLVPRQNESLRYELKNGIALCPRHHQFDPQLSPHLNAAGWLQFLADVWPGTHTWYVWRVEQGIPQFEGTKNAAYYVQVIQSLRPYVPGEQYVQVVGVRFSAHLEDSY